MLTPIILGTIYLNERRKERVVVQRGHQAAVIDGDDVQKGLLTAALVAGALFIGFKVLK